MSGHGGKRENSGRPKRNEEADIIAKLKPLEPLFIKAMTNKLKECDMQAAKLYAAYYYGQPTNKMELSGKDGSDIIVNIVPPSDI